MEPTQAGFLNFLRTVMGIPTSVLPDSAPVISIAFCVAVEIVNRLIQQASPKLYELAVYNLAGNNVIEFAQDTPPSTYFADLRAKFKIDSFISGVIQSAGDEGTNSSYVVPEQFQNLTIADLQNLKTPWGRYYLGIAQKYGQTIWGLS